MGIARPLPTSPFLFLSFSSFFFDGVKRLDFLRLLRDVVGVDDGVGRSLLGAGSVSVMAGVVGGGGGAMKPMVVTAPGALTLLNPSSLKESVLVMAVSSGPLP